MHPNKGGEGTIRSFAVFLLSVSVLEMYLDAEGGCRPHIQSEPGRFPERRLLRRPLVRSCGRFLLSRREILYDAGGRRFPSSPGLSPSRVDHRLLRPMPGPQPSPNFLLSASYSCEL